MGEVAFRRWLVGVFLLLSLAKMAFHEPWRDELNTWLIALATGSLGEFYAILDYGGHPRLWHTCVWLLALLTDDFRAVQLFQVVVATGAVWTFTRFAPFSRSVRLLFAFGYFPLFEYGVISRPYALGMLFTFCACAAFARRPRDPLLLVLPLVFLMQTTVYGVLIALALALGWIVDTLLSVRRGDERRPPGGRLVAAASVFGAALAFSVVQMMPAPDAVYAEGWRSGWEPYPLLRALRGPAQALLPIFRWQVEFWGRHTLKGAPFAFAGLGAALLLGSAWFFRRRPIALLVWASGTAACLAFAYLKFSGTVRHSGTYFILFLAACWLAGIDSRSGPARLEPLRSRLLAAGLAIHLMAGVFASCVDLAVPFSASREAGRFMRESALGQLPVVGDRHAKLVPVTYYLGRPIFFPDWETYGTFHYHRRDARDTGEEVVMAAAHELAAKTRGDVVLALSYRLESQPENVELVRRFERSIVPTERYHVYVLRSR
jgi:hypothetical protein